MDLNQILNYTVGSFSVGSILAAVITFVIGFLILKIVYRLVSRILDKSRLNKTLLGFIKAAVHVVLYFVLAVVVLEALGVSIVSLVAVFSVAGLAISLAAENALSNLAGGVLLLIMNPFVVGDFIEVSGKSGTVRAIGLTYTEIVTPDNCVVYLPNKDISASNITNLSKEDRRRVDLTFSASYDTPTESVKAAILQAAAGVEGVLTQPDPPFVNIESYDSSSITYVTRVWCKPADYWNVHFALTEAVRAAFHEHGVEMTYDHLNIHVVNQK